YFHDYSEYAGIFGEIKNNEIKNLNIDYMGGAFNDNIFYGGALAGRATNVNIHDIALSNFRLNGFGYEQHIGNLIGRIDGGKYNNIYIKNSSANDGGFAAEIKNGEFNNIKIDMRNSNQIVWGGFAKNIYNGVFKNIEITHNGLISGGFSYEIFDGDFRNIKIIGIGNKQGLMDYGFSWYLGNGYFQDILLENFRAYADGFGIYRDYSNKASAKNIIIRDAEFRSGGGGFGNIGNAENILLENLTFYNNNGFTGFSGFGSASYAKNIILRNIDFIGNYRVNGFGWVNYADNIILENINFTNTMYANGFGNVGSGGNIILKNITFENNLSANGFSEIINNLTYANNILLENIKFIGN
ncbi:hypothetical protein I9P32_06505, partial [Campylobacter peloridis]|nr:hypothetical protein [Campylobacter peloridis]